MHGQFIWYELTTPDVAAAQKFYPTFTGWGTQPFDDDYTMWTTGGVPFAGIVRLTDAMREHGVPPNWMPYVESSNVDDTAAKVTSLGGQVVQSPRDIPGVGRYAVVQDPQGAVFGVYKSSRASSSGWDGTPVVGRFSWHELMTTDYVKAFEFYRALFGWEKTGEMDMGGGSMYFMFGKGDKMYGGMFNRPPEMAGMHPFWLVYIHVKDVGKAVATAIKAGATVHRPQMDIPGGSIAILGDPQGAGFAVHHASARAATSRPAAKKAAPAKSKSRAKNAASKKAAAKKSPRKKATPSARPKAKSKAARNVGPRAKATARPKAKARAKSASRAKKRARARRAR
jgi:predicted enzyme related to lactoylglutathione lyase